MSTTTERPRSAQIGAGHVAVAALAAWAIFVLVGGLDGIGRHFVILGALRIVLFGALLAFAVSVGAHTHRLGRAGLIVAGVGAVAYLAGGVGSVVTDGWSYDVFASDSAVETPWYAYVMGLTGIIFALGTLLVGIAGRRSGGGRLAVAVILAGALFPALFVLQPLGHTVGHMVYFAPWMALAIGLTANGSPMTAAPRALRTAAHG